MNNDRDDEDQDPEIEVELEEDGKNEEGEPDLDKTVGDRAPSSTMPPTEPVDRNFPAPFVLNSKVIKDIRHRLGKDLTTADYEQGVLDAVEGIVSHFLLNETKSLETCAAGFAYARIASLPPGMTSMGMIQVITELFAAYKRMLEIGMCTRETTPPGTRIH